MSIAKKKIFPKVKKKFQNFLTDESGKITKKWALWLSAGAALLSVFDNVDAAIYHHNMLVNPEHSNSNPGVFGHQNTVYWNYYNLEVDYTPGVGCSQNHASWLVNGHANQVIDTGGTLTQTAINGISGHANHVSHSNQGSGGWC